MTVPPEDQSESVNSIRESYGVPIAATSNEGVSGALPYIKPEDMQYLGKLLLQGDETSDDDFSKEELAEEIIMTILLKVKSGTPPQRKIAMQL